MCFSDPLALSNKTSTAQLFDNMSLDIEQLLGKVCQFYGLHFLSVIVGLHHSGPVCRSHFPYICYHSRQQTVNQVLSLQRRFSNFVALLISFLNFCCDERLAELMG